MPDVLARLRDRQLGASMAVKKEPIRGGIFGEGNDNGIFGNRFEGINEAPVIRPEERLETFTCDGVGCKESRTAIDGYTVRTSGDPLNNSWLMVGDRHYCALHRAARMEEGCLGRQITENIFDGKEQGERVDDRQGGAQGAQGFQGSREPEPDRRYYYLLVGFLTTLLVASLLALALASRIR